MKSDNAQMQVNATKKFRKVLSIPHAPPIEEVIRAGVVPRFVQFLKCTGFPEIQFEAAWALTNIASETSENTAAVVDSGTVPVPVQLLRSPSDDVSEQAMGGLRNIAGDCPKYRDMVLGENALHPLLEQLNDGSKLVMLRTATWAVSNLCRGKPKQQFDQLKDALPALARLLQSNKDIEVLLDACWALSYLTDGLKDQIQAVIDTGVCQRLGQLLSCQNAGLMISAL